MTIGELIESLESLKLNEASKDIMLNNADELFKKASREQNHKGMMVADYYKAAYYFYYEHNLTKSTQYVKSSIGEANAFSAFEYLMKSYCLDAFINIDSYNMLEALEETIKAQKIAEDRDDIIYKIFTNNIIGDIFFRMNDFSVAASYYKVAKDYFEKSDIEPDYIYHKCLFDYIIILSYQQKYDLLDSSINLGLMKFNGRPIALEYKVLKDIIALYKKLNYVERSIVDDIYSLFLEIEEISDQYDRIKILLAVEGLIVASGDNQLYKEYCELLESYAYYCDSLALVERINEIKIHNNSITSDELIDFYTNKENYIIGALDNAIKKVLSLNSASEERDSEIEKNKQLIKISSIDELTKLYNRRSGVDLIKKALDDVTKADYAFIMLDIDDFKSINDTYGHGSGDKALVFLAGALQEMFDKDSIVVRLAGDEFVVLLYNLPTDIKIRKSVVTYKLELLINYLADASLDFIDNNNMSVSAGVVLEKYDFDKLYSKADEALYTSKDSGKGKFSVSGENIEE